MAADVADPVSVWNMEKKRMNSQAPPGLAGPELLPPRTRPGTPGTRSEGKRKRAPRARVQEIGENDPPQEGSITPAGIVADDDPSPIP